MSHRTVVVGEALVDIVRRPDGTMSEHPGGSPANVAIGMARLGSPVELVTRFGTDERGDAIRDHLLANEGLAIAEGSQQGDHTSTAEATLDASGAATYAFDLHWDVADALRATMAGPAVTHLHTGSIAATLQPGASAVLDAALAARATGTVSYDPNARPQIMGEPHDVRAQIEQLVGVSDVVKASDEDLAWLYEGAPVGEIMRLWSTLGPALVVVTHGGDGYSALVTGTGEFREGAGYPVDVVDTVGAGDSFMSGLLAGLLDDGLLGGAGARETLHKAPMTAFDRALRLAVAASAVTVSRAGANPPTRDELRL